MRILFIFMDGVGLGGDDPNFNPLVKAALPNLDKLLGGHKIVAKNPRGETGEGNPILHNENTSLIPLDACLGVDGLPQSATGQASLMTGKNVSALVGMHDGPKPSPEIMEILRQGTLFSELAQSDTGACLLNAYPPRYFESIENGRRLPGVIALSAIYAQGKLRTKDDLFKGEALSVDFTGRGWKEQLGFHDTPQLDLTQAGERLANLSAECGFAMFEYWLSDVAGHRRDIHFACELLEQFDRVLGSLVDHWNGNEGLILVTSDHGNIEDLSTRHHTRNDVPLLLIGSRENRSQFLKRMDSHRGSRNKYDLTDIAPAILSLVEH